MGLMRQKYTFSKSIQEQLSQLRTLDNWHGLVGAFYDYGVIAFGVALFYLSAWFYPISVLLIGSRQRAFATLLHESVHLCLAKSRFLNRLLGTYMSGYLIFQEYNTYRDSHVKNHHAYLGDPEKDPDYQYHLDEKLYQYHGCFQFFKRFILKPLMLLKTTSYLWYLVRFRMVPSKRYLKSFAAMFTYWLAIIATCAYFHCTIDLLLLWFVPLLTSSAIIGWFNELAEHYPLIGKHHLDIHMTRNRFSHWLEHFICNTHAENYHLVHHLQAAIPFWKLKQAHQILCQDSLYAELNQTMGGIFVSNNKNPSLLQKLLSEPAVNQKGNVQYE
jgi:fatty acid desaturase